MKPITFDTTCYRIDGQPVYLNSGEFHYFRVPKADWRARMDLFKAAGGNCIATYIPWLIHEPREGDIRFGGADGVLDLEGFLHTAQEAGLYVAARPGPYQYSELLYAGLPGWLFEKYPEIQSHTPEGKPFGLPSVSYLHPVFLEKARAWFDAVCPIIAGHTVSKGGPVAFVQFDNELTGVHVWFGGLDYNATTMGFGQADGRYTRFLRARFGDIAALNRRYDAHYARFEDVRPVAPSDSARPSDLRRLKDYFDFYLGTVAEYAQILCGWMRAHGIDTPFIHNAANPGMNAYFLETKAALDDSFLLGSDHYYNLGHWERNSPTPQYAIKIFTSHEILRLMGYPPTVFELPGGAPFDWPPITREDTKACYLANIALGMKGHNYYIYTGGPNPSGTGTTTDFYDYNAAVGANNEIRPHYHAQQEVGLFMKDNAWLVESERAHDFRLALDFEHARAHAYWPARGDYLFTSADAWKFLSEDFLAAAFCASLSPAFFDLGADDWIGDRNTPVVVVASVSMARAKQARLVSFLKQGGRALILPALPALDENLEPCTVLSDFLGSPTLRRCTNDNTRATVAGVPNVWDRELFYCETWPAGAQILGRDELTDAVFAWQVGTEGGGQVIFLGLTWGHLKHEHFKLLVTLLEGLGLQQQVVCSNPNVWTSLRTAGDRSMLFILNLFASPMEAEIGYRSQVTGKMVPIGRRTLAPMTVEAVAL